MPSPRIQAVRILRQVVQENRRPDEILFGLEGNGPDDRDLRFLTELVYGVLRNLLRLDFYIERLAGRSPVRIDVEVLWILRVGLYQMEFLRVPDRAAVHQAVGSCRFFGKSSAAGFVNALLRGFQRRKPVLPKGDSPPELAVRYSVPEWLVRRYLRRYGPQQTLQLLKRWQGPPEACLWVNPFLNDWGDFQRLLEEAGIAWEPFPELPGCLRILSPSFARHPLYLQGRAFFIDPGSLQVAKQGDLSRCRRIGDLCAAPGNKASVLASRMPSEARLIAADVSPVRLRTLRDRLALHRVPRTSVLKADLSRPAPFRPLFDFILLDVPCSGLGTLASNPDIRWKVNEFDLLRHQKWQLKMLGEAFAVLRPGGELVYATCSTEPEENEEVVERFLKEQPRAQLAAAPLKTFPEAAAGEAFYAARIRHVHPVMLDYSTKSE